jgi:predicted RNase H-like HicB family nuclease
MRKKAPKSLALQYACTFHPLSKGYGVRCPAFPEIVTSGKTLDEARKNAREAVQLCLDVYRDKGWPVPSSEPAPRTLTEFISVPVRA